MAYVITGRCVGCGSCIKECPAGAIHEGDGGSPAYIVDMENCLGCGMCRSVCMYDAPVDEMELREHPHHFHPGMIDYRRLGHGDWLTHGGLDAARKQDEELYDKGCQMMEEGHRSWGDPHGMSGPHGWGDPHGMGDSHGMGGHPRGMDGHPHGMDGHPHKK